MDDILPHQIQKIRLATSTTASIKVVSMFRASRTLWDLVLWMACMSWSFSPSSPLHKLAHRSKPLPPCWARNFSMGRVNGIWWWWRTASVLNGRRARKKSALQPCTVRAHLHLQQWYANYISVYLFDALSVDGRLFILIRDGSCCDMHKLCS